jgi:hypothetical protein
MGEIVWWNGASDLLAPHLIGEVGEAAIAVRCANRDVTCAHDYLH